MILYQPNYPSPEDKYPESNPPMYRSPGEYYYDFDTLQLLTADGFKLHGWFIKQKKNFEKCPTIIFFHGNAGNIGARLPNVDMMYK